EAGERLGLHRERGLEAPRLDETEHLALDEVGDLLAELLVAEGGEGRLEEPRDLRVAGEDAGVVGREAELLDVARALRVGELGERGADRLDALLGDADGREIRAGEVAVVVRLF